MNGVENLIEIRRLMAKLPLTAMTKKDKNKARAKARAFLRRHKIVRPECPCGNSKPQMHHPDYEKPLQVMFLCVSCHTKEHSVSGWKWSDAHLYDLNDLIPKSVKKSDAFTPSDIRRIRKLYRTDPKPETVNRLAEAFMVSRPTIRGIILVKTWKWVA